jgi:tRNA (guanine37-N1)-methyltransferase
MGGSWREHVDVPDDVRETLPRGYDVVGDVAIVRLPGEADPYLAEIGRGLVEAVPPAETAAVDRGVEGDLRLRSLEVVAGEGDLVTLQKENGCRLTVDLARTYFSPRLAHERARVAGQVAEGERVLDMYAGVGPYAVLVAKRGADVLGLDANPRAVELARENAGKNKVADRVEVAVADAAQLVPALAASFDRVVMNLPHTGADHLAEALSVLAPGGHVHLACILEMDHHRDQAREIADEHGLVLDELVHVRNYNPALGHYALDLHRPSS